MLVAPAIAQAVPANAVLSAAPLVVTIGAGGFGILALVALRHLRLRTAAALAEARGQIAALRAQVDGYEALLAGTREVTVMWSGNGDTPNILGPVPTLLPPGRRPDTLLQWLGWLGDSDAESLAEGLRALKVDGKSFELSLHTRDGRLLRAAGWVLGSGSALRLRLAQSASAPTAADAAAAQQDAARSLVTQWPDPAFLRKNGRGIVHANLHWHKLAQQAGQTSREAAASPMMDAPTLQRHLAHLAADGRATTRFMLGEEAFELSEFALAGLTCGVLRPVPLAPVAEKPPVPLNRVVEALREPVAVFDARRRLVEFNDAYAGLWGLDPAWLRTGPDERTILDRLRTQGALPSEANYQDWRDRHLSSYALTEPREDPWYLPGGRAINVVAAPIGKPGGGVVYVFEDLSEVLKLETMNRALSSVQRETLNALNEGVAVFGTNGRLTLYNPRLSALWALPMNELEVGPHIDEMARLSSVAFPEDGATVWRELKRRIVDLTPNRGDARGRVNRSDGRLLDYAVTRLPDGQTMMTFVDVSESANFSRLLKERNDALVMADRLKDAFVQNVSYELRSPLTNIIGFADLLASGTFGSLNDRQKSYTDYIRASSATLRVLVDNILDLANVDAGIAELTLEPLDVTDLVEKARAGLAATLPPIDGQQPVDLRIEIAPDLPTLVADGTRIVQVLYNLLSNAARFSPRGSTIRLKVAARGNDRVTFTVEDEGTGPSTELTAALSERADPSGRQRGAGLGLAIVRTFVNLHGGSIGIEALEPRGTRVTVILPRQAQIASAGAAE